MDWLAAVTEWKCFRKEVRTHWAKLSESQLDVIGGHRARLIEEIRVSYSMTLEQAEQQLSYFERSNEYLRAVSLR